MSCARLSQIPSSVGGSSNDEPAAHSLPRPPATLRPSAAAGYSAGGDPVHRPAGHLADEHQLRLARAGLHSAAGLRLGGDLHLARGLPGRRQRAGHAVRLFVHQSRHLESGSRCFEPDHWASPGDCVRGVGRHESTHRQRAGTDRRFRQRHLGHRLDSARHRLVWHRLAHHAVYSAQHGLLARLLQYPPRRAGRPSGV